MPIERIIRPSLFHHPSKVSFSFYGHTALFILCLTLSVSLTLTGQDKPAQLSPPSIAAFQKWKNHRLPDSIRINALTDYADEYMRKKPDEVAYILTNAAQNFKGIRNTNLKHHLYFKLAYLNIIRGNIESATQYADSMSLMCQADPACRAGALNIHGMIFRVQGNHQKALEFYFRSAAIYDSVNHIDELLNVYSNIGEANLNMGDYETSLKYLLLALEKNKKAHPESKGLPMVANNIGVLFERQEQYEKALPYYHLGEVIYTEMKDTFRLADVLNNMGVIHKNLGQTDSALYYYRKSLKYKLLMKNSDRVSTTLYNIFNLYFNLDEIDSAKAAIQKGIAVRKDAEVFGAVDAYLHLGMGKILNREKKYHAALEWSHKGLSIALKRELKRVEEDAYLYLTDIYRNAGNTERALHYYEKYVDLANERKNAEKTAELHQMIVENKFRQERYADSLNYANERSMKELVILQQQKEIQYDKMKFRLLMVASFFLLVIAGYIYKINRDKIRINKKLRLLNTEVSQQKETIEKSLARKETLLKEIHHRVKNNLQVVSSLLSLQSSNLQDKSLLSVFEEGQNRIEAIVLVHNKLYETDDLANVNLRDYIEQLIGHIKDTFKTRNHGMVIVQGDDVLVDMDTAVPLGLIVNEITTNAFKYAFNQGGDKFLVHIKATAAQECEIILRDNGPGLPDHVKLEQSETLGLKLIRLLSIQLKASLQCNCENGVTYSLKFNYQTLENELWNKLKYS